MTKVRIIRCYLCNEPASYEVNMAIEEWLPICSNCVVKRRYDCAPLSSDADRAEVRAVVKHIERQKEYAEEFEVEKERRRHR